MAAVLDRLDQELSPSEQKQEQTFITATTSKLNENIKEKANQITEKTSKLKENIKEKANQITKYWNNK